MPHAFMPLPHYSSQGAVRALSHAIVPLPNSSSLGAVRALPHATVPLPNSSSLGAVRALPHAIMPHSISTSLGAGRALPRNSCLTQTLLLWGPCGLCLTRLCLSQRYVSLPVCMCLRVSVSMTLWCVYVCVCGCDCGHAIVVCVCGPALPTWTVDPRGVSPRWQRPSFLHCVLPTWAVDPAGDSTAVVRHLTYPPCWPYRHGPSTPQGIAPRW